MNANFVIFETNSKQFTVALLAKRGQSLQVWAHQNADVREPAQQGLIHLDTLLSQGNLCRQDLSAIAFGQGPGAFTGLRVACGLAQGLAFALDIPVIPLSSLLTIAAHDRQHSDAQAAQAWVVLQDARMEEVYAAVYTLDPHTERWQTLHPPCLVATPAVPQWLATCRARWVDGNSKPLTYRLVGNALIAYPALADLHGVDSIGRTDPPDANTLAQRVLQAWEDGETVPPELASPLYVRDKIAYTTRERSTGLGGNPRVDTVLCATPAPVIVPMTEQHLAQVVEIERTVQSFPWTWGNFRDALQANNSAWVLLQDNHVHGFYVLMCAPDVAHLLVIAVARKHQRRGLGRWLMQHAQQQATSHGLATLILEVRPSNQPALAFYQQLGFETLAVRKDYYPTGQQQREDAWVLRKVLSPQGGQP